MVLEVFANPPSAGTMFLREILVFGFEIFELVFQ